MAQLFKRRVILHIGDLQVEGLRTQFKVKKTSGKEPNTCELSVYNLLEQHRAALQSKGTKFAIEAGYESDVAQIFSGQSSYVDHTHDRADWITKIQCSDGERAYRWARVGESYHPGTPVAEVFARIADATGLDVADAKAYVASVISDQFVQGYSASGKASKEIDRILSGRGFDWSIQDGKLQVTLTGQALKGLAVVLSANTGMIGSPAYGSPLDGGQTPTLGEPKPVAKKQVLKAKSLLQARFAPGVKVSLDSRSIKGLFRIEALTHTGDTHAGEFYSELDLVPIS